MPLRENRAVSAAAAGLGSVGQLASRGRHAIGEWLLRRRRARASGRKSTSRRTTWALSASLILLLVLFGRALMLLGPSTGGRELSIGEFAGLAAQNRLAGVTFHDEDAIVAGRYVAEPLSPPTTNGDDSSIVPSGEFAAEGDRAPEGEGRFWVAYPAGGAVTPVLIDLAARSGADIRVDPQTSKKGVRLVATFLLPLMILANLFALLFTASRGSSSGIGEVITFGSIGKRRQRKRSGGAGFVNFSSIAGADEAVAELREVVDYLKDPKRYGDIGATPPKGVLLFGPPGCGKTLLAKAVAGEAEVPFFSVAGAEFVESLVGVGAARVRDLFLRVRAVAPAIVFIDELDAAGRKRGQGGGGGGSDEREQTLNQLLVDMDGFEVSAGIVVIGATNRPDILDPALLRPGRFDRHVTIDQPDMVGRQQILELHAGNKPVSPAVDFTYLARRTPGFSGADLANVLNEAALLTVREGKPEIEMPELEEAIQRVIAGPQKRGRVLTPEERKRLAYHESGHAILAAASGHLEDASRVSILARGRGLGSTAFQQDGDAVLLTSNQLTSRLVTLLAGQVAERIVFGSASTGAEHDLEEATDIARDMVGRFGMGSKRRRLLSKEGEGFLGDDVALASISAQTHHEMEVEIDRLLEDAEREAQRILVQHRPSLDTLATKLEIEETLEGTDLESLLAAVRPEVTLFGELFMGSENGLEPHPAKEGL